MSIDIITLVVNITVGGIGAFIGAFITLRRFRHERGFEKRLKWYEDAISANEQLAKACLKAVYKLTESDVNMKEIWEILGPAHNNYLEILPHACFYAPKKTFEGLGQTTRITAAIHKATSPTKNKSECITSLNKVVELLLMANAILINEMRSQLGLGKVKRPPWVDTIDNKAVESQK